jgi:hypothetical protein
MTSTADNLATSMKALGQGGVEYGWGIANLGPTHGHTGELPVGQIHSAPATARRLTVRRGN